MKTSVEQGRVVTTLNIIFSVDPPCTKHRNRHFSMHNIFQTGYLMNTLNMIEFG